jgi:hypothetical protein
MTAAAPNCVPTKFSQSLLSGHSDEKSVLE